MAETIVAGLYRHGVENIKHTKFALCSPSSVSKTSSSSRFLQTQRDERHLRVGFIGTEALYEDLAGHVEIFPLLQKHWKRTVRWASLDFIIIESCYKSFFGDWSFYQVGGSEANNEICELISFCNRKDVKVAYFDRQDDTRAGQFCRENALKHVFQFCPTSVKKHFSDEESEKPVDLQIFFDEKKFNPFLVSRPEFEVDESQANLTILFERFSLLDSDAAIKSIFDSLENDLSCELVFFDRDAFLFDSRSRRTPYYKKMKGCLPRVSNACVFEGVDIWFDVVDSKESVFGVAKRAVEAAGSYVLPIIFDPYEFFPQPVKYANLVCSIDELMYFLYSLESDGVYMNRLRHCYWREAAYNHGVAKVFGSVVRSLGVGVDDNQTIGEFEWPKVGVIVSSIRANKLMEVVSSFDSYSYDNKELILITHGYAADDSFLQGIADRPDVKLYSMPKSATVGECLNLGVEVASSAILMRMDDDDIYGVNYILDVVLQLMASGADFLVKPKAPIAFENQDDLLLRGPASSLVYCCGEDLKKYRLNFGGNSFSGARKFFLSNPFDERNIGACDAATLRSLQGLTDTIFCIGDIFNLIAVRGGGVEGHTWKASEEELRRKFRVSDMHVSDFLV